MNNFEFLSSLLKTAQCGQVEIRSILDTPMCRNLRDTLEAQLREYDSMETEALIIAHRRGWELNELDHGLRFLMDKRNRFRLNGRNTDSRIADIMIQNNTRSMIRGLKKLHQFKGEDFQLRILSQKILDCETSSIRQLQEDL